MTEAELVSEAQAYVEATLGREIGDFHATLKDGTVLCDFCESDALALVCSPMPEPHLCYFIVTPFMP